MTNRETAAQPPAHWPEELRAAFWTAVNAPTYDESAAATLALVRQLAGIVAEGEATQWPGPLADLIAPTRPAAVSVPPPAPRADAEPEFQVWPLQRVLTEVRCGSEDWSWEEEWADLDRRHAETGYLSTLEQQIRANGITMPVLIGSDGRLWDGHHRLRLAVRLGIGYVPVEITPRHHAAVSGPCVAGEQQNETPEAEVLTTAEQTDP